MVARCSTCLTFLFSPPFSPTPRPHHSSRAVERRRDQAALALVFKAAQKIQARWRGVMGRAKMRRVREHRAKYLGEVARQEKAARELRVLVLQAVYRGHLGRELYRERLIEIEGTEYHRCVCGRKTLAWTQKPSLVRRREQDEPSARGCSCESGRGCCERLTASHWPCVRTAQARPKISDGRRRSGVLLLRIRRPARPALAPLGRRRVRRVLQRDSVRYAAAAARAAR